MSKLLHVCLFGSVASKLAKAKHLHLSAKKEMFKGHCFPKSIILLAVYLKLRFSLSYRDIEELLAIRGVKEDAQKVVSFAKALAEFLFVLPSKIQRGIENALP